MQVVPSSLVQESHPNVSVKSDFRPRKALRALGTVYNSEAPSLANSKFMLMVSPETYHRLEAKAKRRGVKIQELLRAVVIPEWLRSNP
jgi:hypothetical protein